jgi:Leucine-rich repeat (LRR) protein
MGSVVNFRDAGLDAAVRDAIKKPSGDIRNSDLVGLSSLDADERNITSLEGIRHCIDLTHLSLKSNRIVEIRSLFRLSNLTNLELFDNQIVDISAVSGLPNLTHLTLSYNQIVDISAVSGLTKLTYLDLGENKVVNISAVSGLTKLTYLGLGKKVVDISALSGLINLEDLDLGKNRIVDISALSSLTNLEDLVLHDNQIVDISALLGLTRLKKLCLQNNQIRDITPLVNNLGIDRGNYVALRANQLDLTPGSPSALNIESLQRRGVEIFFGSQNPVSKSLIQQRDAGLVLNFPDPGLEAAIREAIGKPSGDIRSFDLIRLSSLDANDRGIKSLKGIQHCVNLSALDLKDNQIRDISPLVNNLGIGRDSCVDLRQNELDLSPGSACTLDIEALRRREAEVFHD